MLKLGLFGSSVICAQRLRTIRIHVLDSFRRWTIGSVCIPHILLQECERLIVDLEELQHKHLGDFGPDGIVPPVVEIPVTGYLRTVLRLLWHEGHYNFATHYSSANIGEMSLSVIRSTILLHRTFVYRFYFHSRSAQIGKAGAYICICLDRSTPLPPGVTLSVPFEDIDGAVVVLFGS